MSKFSKTGEPINRANKVAAPSGYCGVDGCGEETTVQFAQVRDSMDRKRVGAFTNFGSYSKHGSESSYEMRDGFRFIGWIERCAACYCNDLHHANRQQIKAGEV